jgi:hypothetical protein
VPQQNLILPQECQNWINFKKCDYGMTEFKKKLSLKITCGTYKDIFFRKTFNKKSCTKKRE